MPLAFETCDVFTDRRFGGNPLAVVYGADALDGAAMQRLAREFALSETVFVLAPRQAGTDAFIRIFTPAVELPFAGHPNVGNETTRMSRATPPAPSGKGCRKPQTTVLAPCRTQSPPFQTISCRRISPPPVERSGRPTPQVKGWLTVW